MENERKFKLGDKVEYTNGNRVLIGEKTIVGFDTRTNLPTYYIEPTDTPWFSVREENLKLL